jgi:hypothetical protein
LSLPRCIGGEQGDDTDAHRRTQTDPGLELAGFRQSRRELTDRSAVPDARGGA